MHNWALCRLGPAPDMFANLLGKRTRIQRGRVIAVVSVQNAIGSEVGHAALPVFKICLEKSCARNAVVVGK